MTVSLIAYHVFVLYYCIQSTCNNVLIGKDLSVEPFELFESLAELNRVNSLLGNSLICYISHELIIPFVSNVNSQMLNSIRLT